MIESQERVTLDPVCLMNIHDRQQTVKEREMGERGGERVDDVCSGGGQFQKPAMSPLRALHNWGCTEVHRAAPRTTLASP